MAMLPRAVAEVLPDCRAGDRLDRIGRVIAKLSEQHVPRDNFVAAVKQQIPELERWVRDHDLVDLDATKPLTVRETPPYQRGIAGASIEAPGPYDPGAPTYYNVTPLDDLSPERAESWLREYNDWMLPILNIHEAVPGHYVQLDLREQVAELDQEHLRQRRDDRRLGRVHRAHDARVRLRRLESRVVADLLEVEPAHRLQHDPRLRGARRHEEGATS